MEITDSGTKYPRGHKTVKKRGIVPRLLLCLMDEKEHEFGEFYDWVKQPIETTTAIRDFQRTFPTELSVSYDKMIEEGRRSSLISCLWRVSKKLGYVEIVWPKAEPARYKAAKGYFDLRKCKLKITSKGITHLIEGPGVYAKLQSELYLGLKTGRLKMSVSYLGIPELEGFSS